MGSADEVEIINHLGELGKLYLMFSGPESWAECLTS